MNADFITITTETEITYTAATPAAEAFLAERYGAGAIATTVAKDSFHAFVEAFTAAGLTCALAESEYTETVIGQDPGADLNADAIALAQRINEAADENSAVEVWICDDPDCRAWNIDEDDNCIACGCTARLYHRPRNVNRIRRDMLDELSERQVEALASPLADPAVTLPHGDGIEAVEKALVAHAAAGDKLGAADLRALATIIEGLRTDLNAERNA